jgi:hypothetical protein
MPDCLPAEAARVRNRPKAFETSESPLYFGELELFLKTVPSGNRL